MSDPQNLTELYKHEMQDIWSANDQMKKVVSSFAEKAGDDKLKKMFEKSVKGIQKHTETLKSMLDDMGAQSKEHCKGMEGLSKEAKKHALEADLSDEVRAVSMISQYQRMSHYGIAGFGTLKAYADALGKDEHKKKLDDALEEIYEADDYASELAERSKNSKAKA